MSRSISVTRSVLVAIMMLLGSFGLAAQSDPLTLSLSVNPTTVAAGGTLVITGSITNKLTRQQTATVQVDVTGPCGYSDTYAYKLALKPSETVTANRTYIAPGCAGDYTLFANATSKSGAAAQVTATFTVQ